jgi:hypothetical protein
MLDEGALERMPPAQSLNRHHASSICVRERHETGIDRQPVDEDRARPALAFTTTLLGACQPAVFAQHVEQPFHRMG